ncbi:DUF1566 domain-containing protein [Geovibrio thiophilus]|uniref:DUF1566 domain-containing protein n=1 Tax=Geovibrio thiophilus TaxID=139438 RepID=A0A3R5XW62_9BACT|nr:DUF1566 domain-containing protein [Geovibrio thiophilus]QAR32564.1 DUF1566 domain-containing protein [Geovibrio thiophilus]
MKGLHFIILAVLILAVGCGGNGSSSKDDSSAYQGYYTGVYSNASVSGAWSMAVDKNGDISGLAEDNLYSYILTGTVDEGGGAAVTGTAGSDANAFIRRTLNSPSDIYIELSFIFNFSSGNFTGEWARTDSQTGFFSGTQHNSSGQNIGNIPPQISGTPVTGITTGTYYSFIPISFDADGDTLTFHIINKPDWALFDNETGALTGTPDNAGVLEGIVITVTDGRGGFDFINSFSITVNQANTPPIVGGTALTSVTAGSAYNFVPAANDADSDTLTFSIENKPSWANFSTTTGALTGTPSNADTGTYSGIVISVSDGNGGTDSLDAFDISVFLPLKKTGQIKSYDSSGTEVTDGSIKDDGYYQKGAAIAYSRDNGIVTDGVTGLTWQDDALSGTVNRADAETYCDGITTGGHNDWRLPYRSEQTTIIDYSRYGQAIDDTFLFKATGYFTLYWSYNDVADDSSYAWGVLFYTGGVYFSAKTADGYARCVRGDTLPTESFNRNDTDKIVTDTLHGLMWQDDEESATDARNWTGAISYCEASELGGYDDWRLPNVTELNSIVDYTAYNPAVSSVFQNTIVEDSGSSVHYWTSTSDAFGLPYAWTVYFDYGIVGSKAKSGSGYTRCVRSIN